MTMPKEPLYPRHAESPNVSLPAAPELLEEPAIGTPDAVDRLEASVRELRAALQKSRCSSCRKEQRSLCAECSGHVEMKAQLRTLERERDNWKTACASDSAKMFEAIDERDALRAELDRAKLDFANACDVGRRQEARAELAERQRAMWEEDALRYCSNADYYKGLVVAIGEPFGVSAKTSDDGSLQQDVLCAKVPELVAALRAEVELLRYQTPQGWQRFKTRAEAAEARVVALEAFVQDFAAEPCGYGDNCPSFGTRHGTCNHCRARRALAPGGVLPPAPADDARTKALEPFEARVVAELARSLQDCDCASAPDGHSCQTCKELARITGRLGLRVPVLGPTP